ANTPELTGWGTININGSLTLIPAMTYTHWGQIKFLSGTAGNTITTAGHTLNNVYFEGSGEYTLQDALELQGWLYFNNGTLYTNNFNINLTNGTFQSNTSNTRVLDLGSSTITTDTWEVSDSTNFTFNPGTSHILYTSMGWQFNGGGLTYNDVTILPIFWGGPLNFYGSSTFNNLNLEPGLILWLDTGTTQTVNRLNATGTFSDYITLQTTFPGFTAEINQVIPYFCG
ncbi:unnamed protein product, partial [marine sediment metagenome]